MRAATGVPSVGTLWSAVASVRSGRRTGRPARRRPVEGLRARDLVDEVQVDVEQTVGDLVQVPDAVEERLAHERRSPADTTASRTASSSPGFSKWWGRSASKVTAVALGELVARAVADEGQRARAGRGWSRARRARASAGRRGRRCGRRAGRVWQETSARWPGSGGVRTSQRWPSAPPERRSPGRTTLTVPPSSRRSSWESRSSSPAAIRPAIVSVGLVSPRSTCESIGAETPERSARSRSERSIDSRSARTRDPTGVPTSIRAYVIAYRGA